MKVLTSGVLQQASPTSRKTTPRIFDNDLIIVDWLTPVSPRSKTLLMSAASLDVCSLPGDDGVKKMRVLSGGEKVRVLFSKHDDLRRPMY